MFATTTAAAANSTIPIITGRSCWLIASIAVSGVEFASARRLIDVPVERGQLRSGPVARTEYVSIAPTRYLTASLLSQ